MQSNIKLLDFSKSPQNTERGFAYLHSEDRIMLFHGRVGVMENNIFASSNYNNKTESASD